MSMEEDFLFGSDLDDSDDEAKAAKGNKESERKAELNELFGDSPSEGEEEAEHAAESDRDEGDSGEGEKIEERENSTQDREEDDNEDESEVGDRESIFYLFTVTSCNDCLPSKAEMTVQWTDSGCN